MRELSPRKCMELKKLLCVGKSKPLSRVNDPLKTGLIKSRRDLIIWINAPEPKFHCAWCKKAIEKDIKCYNHGFCDECKAKIVKDDRCVVCFERISVRVDCYSVESSCRCCNARSASGFARNPRGYAEGGKLSGGLRTDFWTDNENDNLVKLYEK